MNRSVTLRVIKRELLVKMPSPTTIDNLLPCFHALCTSYVPNTFLLVGSSGRSKKLLCFVQSQGQKENNTIPFH